MLNMWCYLNRYHTEETQDKKGYLFIQSTMAPQKQKESESFAACFEQHFNGTMSCT